MNIRRLEQKDRIPYDLLLSADPSRSAADDYLDRGYVFAAETEAEIVGVYVLLRTRPQTAEIVNIAVREAYQGQGIGIMLIRHAAEQAKALQARTLEIGTGNSSLKQLALYQKCGFRITGVERDFFVKHYDEPIVEDGIPCVDMIRLSLTID